MRDVPAGIERFGEQCRVSDLEGRRTPVGFAARGGDGCLAFVPELRDVVCPHKFRPEVAHKYEGTTNPHEFLQVYYTACQAAGGNTKVMANWFPLALQPETRSWLMNLPPNSIRSWDDLCDQFVGAFQGGYA